MGAYLIHLLVLAVLISFGHSSIIGTGRGVIAAVQIGTNRYGLEEADFGYEAELNFPQTGWNLETDPRFPNGQFLRSQYYTDLVWDTKGYQFSSGTPVVLYQKKDTLVDTKNQRWVFSNNRFSIIHNQNMVANVTNDRKVVLAPKSQSPFQQFYLIGRIIRRSIQFTNKLPVTAYIHFFSPVGQSNSGAIPGPNGRSTERPIAGPGNYAIIRDGSGNTLAGPYDIIDRLDDIYVLPPPGPIPEGTNVWKGYMIDEEGQESNVTYTLTFNPQLRTLYGSGNDIHGTFEFEGDYYNSGDCIGYKTGSGPSSFVHAILDSTGRRLIEENKLYLQY